VGYQDDHEDHQHDNRLDEVGDVALRAPPKRKGFLTHRNYAIEPNGIRGDIHIEDRLQYGR
jgi:hypothetical protein